MQAGFGVMLMVMLIQGSTSDLLDFVDSTSYWKAQQVEMTVDALAGCVREAPAADSKSPKAGEVRRLMAIRALGELKQKEALVHLKPLVNETAPFVADYARQAIATIEGTPYRRGTAERQKLASDVDLLPAGCGVVAQTTISGGGPVSYDAMFEQLKGMQPGQDPARFDEQRRRVTDALIELTSALGNVRLEAVTLGVAADVGNQAGFVVLIARGTYDAAAARQALKADKRVETETVEDVEVYRRDREVAMVCPSNDRFILFAGPGPEQMPLEQMLGALKKGKGGVDTDEDIAYLLGAVDRTKRTWAVMKMTDAYKNAQVFAPFDSVTLTADDKEDETFFTLVARGQNADEIGVAVDKFQLGRQQALDAMRKAGPGRARVLPKGIVDFVDSVQVVQEGPQVTVTAVFKGRTLSDLGTMPLMFLGQRLERQATLRKEAQRETAVPERPEPAPQPEPVPEQ